MNNTALLVISAVMGSRFGNLFLADYLQPYQLRLCMNDIFRFCAVLL